MASSVSPTPIKLKGKLLRRFYEPLVLLVSLQDSVRKQKYAPETGLLSEALSPVEPAASYPTTSLSTFVNNLAKACDSSRGGDTVTAFAILQEPDRVVYTLASNNRDEHALQATKDFVGRLLNTLKDAPVGEPASKGQKAQSRATRKLVFGQILRFHHQRIKVYIRNLSGSADSIRRTLELCGGDDAEEEAILMGGLEPLRQLVDKCSPEMYASDDEYVEHVENLILALYRHISENKGKAGKTMVSLVRERLRRGNEAWAEFDHYAGRIASYYRCVSVLMGARRQWHALFDKFEIVTIPSSDPIRKPLKDATTAEEMIGRMTADVGDMAKYRDIAENLQRYHDLDPIMQAKCGNKKWKPRVHCEILLLDWIEHSPGGLRPERFFGSEKYIGTSKPSCALCFRYFELHGGQVAVRNTHGNFYIFWRTPDVFQEAARKKMESIMLDLVVHIRRRAFGLLEEKAPVVKRFDSITSTSYPDDFRTHGSLLSGGLSSMGYGSGAPCVVTKIDPAQFGGDVLSVSLDNSIAGRAEHLEDADYIGGQVGDDSRHNGPDEPDDYADDDSDDDFGGGPGGVRL